MGGSTTRAQDRLPEDLIDPLDRHRLPSSDRLDGERYSIALLNGGTLAVDLAAGGRAKWATTGLPWPTSGEGGADVVEIIAGVFFVDIDIAKPERDALTVVILREAGWALAIYQRRVIPDEPWSRGPEVTQDFRVGRLDGQTQIGAAPALTRDLVGARNLYRMSDANLYEHIYINSRKVVIHHVHTNIGPGKADCHPATFYKLSDDLYLVGFRELDVAAGMVIVEDYANQRMTGKVLHPVSMFQSASRQLGALMTPVNGRLDYPEGHEPL